MRACSVVVVCAALAAPVEALAQARAQVDVSAGLGAFSRHLSFHQDIFGRFAPYDLAAAPLVAVDGAVYPLARTSLPVLRDVGLVGRWERAFAVTSRGADGADRDTTFEAFDVGLRGRAPFAWGELGLGARWSRQSLRVAAGAGAPVPEAVYDAARVTLDGALTFDRWRLGVGLAWLFVFDGGPFTGTYFPRADMHGVDGALTVSYALTAGFEVRASALGRRYFHAIHPQPGDVGAVGGALDQTLSATLALAWRR